MTDWPHSDKIMIVEHGIAEIANQKGRLRTCVLRKDRYVRVDDANDYPILFKDGKALVYQNNKQLAHDCNARLYRTRVGFERAADHMRRADNGRA